MNTHEDYHRRLTIEGGSNRGFGFVFACFFLAVALWPLLEGGAVRLWAVGASAAMLATALVRPAWLTVPNLYWTRLSALMARVVNPVVTAVLFYVVVTPMAVLARIFGRDALRLRIDPTAESYWLERTPPGPSPESMGNQF